MSVFIDDDDSEVACKNVLRENSEMLFLIVHAIEHSLAQIIFAHLVSCLSTICSSRLSTCRDCTSVRVIASISTLVV